MHSRAFCIGGRDGLPISEQLIPRSEFCKYYKTASAFQQPQIGLMLILQILGKLVESTLDQKFFKKLDPDTGINLTHHMNLGNQLTFSVFRHTQLWTRDVKS